MSCKNFFVMLVALMMLMFSTSAAEESANAKLVRIEIDTYGTEQSGALLDRIGRLEKDFSGRNMVGNMNARIEAIYDTLYNNSAGPCTLAKINALEWNTNHLVQSGGINFRLTALENQILGKTTEGTYNERIRALAAASYGAEILPIAQVQIPAGTLIKVETTAPAGTKYLQEGDSLPVRVAEDVFVDGILVFAKGLPGEGTVENVRRAKNIFTNGKLETDFHTLKTIDGQRAAIFTGIEAQEAMNANGMARGLSLVGQTFSGKNKEIEEVLIRGKNIELPAGIELYVQIKEPIVVYGVRTDGVGGIMLEEVNVTPVAQTLPLTSSEPDVLIERVDPEPNESTSQTPASEQSNTPAPTESQTPAPSTPPPAQGDDLLPDERIYDDGEIIEIIDEG
ncbi:MAG: hypothetical protein J5497_05120 [Selenomonadaceae bacterium]|nr:hypothetical protein [Selenomonadaceae bacterium]